MIPRDYQLYAVEEIFRFFEEGNTGNPVVAMPTGTGKSLVIAWFIKEVFRRFSGQRIIKLTHVKELIEQNMSTLLAVWPTAPAGIFSAGIGRKETFTPIVFAGIASAINVAESFGFVHLVIVDECHLVSPTEGTMYRTFIETLKKVNQNLKVIGFTATNYRLGQGLLTEEGGIFTDTCVDMTKFDVFNWFVDQGYLVPLVPRKTSEELDVRHVKIQNGEFNQKQLQDAVDKEVITRAALQESVRLGENRKHWLVFASGIKHAEHCAEELNRLGVPATFIHSKLSTEERDKRLADFKSGKYRAMVNNGILTTGFDFRALDMIVMLRPTASPGLWVQMLGRGTRAVYADGFDLTTVEGRLAAIAASEKQDCLVLDFARNTPRLGPVNDPVIPKKRGKGSGEAPVKICEVCQTYCHASARFCPVCKTEFKIRVKIKATAGDEELLRKTEYPEIVEIPVDHITYTQHRKPGYPASLKVSYSCGLRTFHEWVCLEHDRYPRHKAHTWWREHSTSKIPETVFEAFKHLSELKQPKAIKVWINKKLPEVREHVF